MAVFKNKIDQLDAEVKLRAGHVTHGFTYRDKPTEMYRDYERAKRVYFDKASGDFLKDEDFHASDFQRKLDLDAQQEQIDENNRVGDQANGPDALDEVILEKKKSARKPKEKPTPSYNLHPAHGKDLEPEDELPEGLHPDHNGNLTDIGDDIFAPEN